MKTARLSHNRMTHEPVASDFYTILKNARYVTHTYVYVCVCSRLYLSNVLSLSLSVLLVQLATFRIQMRFDCHPSRRESRAKPSGTRQALGSMGSLVRFMGHNCTSASCGAWNLCHNTEDGRKEGKGDTLRLLLLYMPFVVRVAASLWVFASIIHA